MATRLSSEEPQRGSSRDTQRPEPGVPAAGARGAAPPVRPPESKETSGSKRPSGGSSRLRAVLLYGALSGVGLLALGFLSMALVVRHYSEGLPSVEELRGGYAPPETTRILGRDGSLLGEIFSERRTVVPFEAIPDPVKAAFLAAEDAHFYEHGGLNYLGLLRAIATNVRAGRLRQGGSTITQQVVKNVLLDSERSLERKVKETILAYRLEQELSKDQILSLYLNHIYLGHGRYGVEEAARYYFGKGIAEVDVGEAATLAGIVASPENYSPRKSEDLAKKRRHFVLGQMLEKGFLAEDVHRVMDAAPIRLAPSVETESDLAPEFVEQARKVLATVAPEKAKRGGFTVTTTLDPELQILARKAVRSGLDRYLKRQKVSLPLTLAKRKLWEPRRSAPLRKHGIVVGHVKGCDPAKDELLVALGPRVGRVSLRSEERYNPTHLPACDFAEVGAELRVRVLDDPDSGTDEHPLRLRLELGPQAALVALDVRTGEVVAAVGSYEALPGGLDRSVQTRRQPGSSFKPLLYSYALDSKRYTLATVFSFPDGAGKTNEDGSPFVERMTLRRGVARSDNRVALEVIRELGPERIVPWAASFGIRSKLGGTESLALGAYEVTPLEMASAYSVFASGGTFDEPRFVLSITSGSGPVSLPALPPRRTVIDPEVAALTTSMLTSVVSDGTAKAALALKRSVAGKTGTTNQAKDAWFVGYSTDLVVAVWVGYDDALPLGGSESGAVTALPIWVEFMAGAHEKRPVTAFPMPDGLVTATIDPETGLLARPDQDTGVLEWFLPGTQPTEESPAADAPEPPSSLVELEEDTPSTPDVPPPLPDDLPPF